MARSPMLGARLRRLRKDRSLTQVKLAEILGISPSYLNMIEHNDRPLTVSLLLKLSDVLGVDLRDFTAGDEVRIKSDLEEAMSDPLFGGTRPSAAELDEFVTAVPDICRAFLRLYRSYRNSREDVEALTDKLASSPYLVASSHSVRTLLTSVRSFSEILLDNIDLAADERQQFLEIVVDGTEKLTTQVDELLRFITGENLEGLLDSRTPWEDVGDFWERNDNFFDDLDHRAETMRAEIGADAVALYPRLTELLETRFGVAVATEPAADGGPAHRLDADDTGAETLVLRDDLAPSSLRFALAREIGRRAAEGHIADLIDEAGLSAAAQPLAADFLAAYFAGAFLMPYDLFLDRAQAFRYDVERLAQTFGVSLEQACHRLATLRRPGQEGVRFHFLRIDRAGNVFKRFSGSGLPIPRFAGICPRWNVHAASGSPGSVDAQVLQLADGSAYLSVAFGQRRAGAGFNAPDGGFALALGCRIEDAGDLVYSAGLDLTRSETFLPVGVTCRLCERTDCGQRAHPTLIHGAERAPAAAAKPTPKAARK
ncbi:MAG: XRE family transcriptional regulator [Rhodospirillaceae bacterium]|nr:XRE family transcriptional regulator [Rhodospirillaceae bacterium]